MHYDWVKIAGLLWNIYNIYIIYIAEFELVAGPTPSSTASIGKGKGKGGKDGKGKGGKDGTEYYNFVPPQMLVVPPWLVDIGVDLQLAGGKLGPIISPLGQSDPYGIWTLLFNVIEL